LARGAAAAGALTAPGTAAAIGRVRAAGRDGGTVRGVHNGREGSVETTFTRSAERRRDTPKNLTSTVRRFGG
jgi:hypothetical protein